MIVAVGEVLMDLVAQGQGATAALLPYAGGSPTNVAMAIARQGGKVAFVGQLATDVWGRHLFRQFAEAGVDTGYLGQSERYSTSLALAQLNEAGESRYTFYLGDAADLHLPRHFLRPPAEAVAAICFGSYSITIPSFRAVVEPYLWQMAQHAVISFDPNIRPQLIPPVAEYQDDWLRWRDLCDIIKLSEEDLAWLWPGRSEAEVVAQCFERRVALFCVSRGARGATLYHRSGARVHCAIPTGMTVVDSIGAGDTLHGALLAYLSREGWLRRSDLARLTAGQLSELLRWAVTAASINCERAGCRPPSMQEIEARLQERV